MLLKIIGSEFATYKLPKGIELGRDLRWGVYD